MLRNKNFFIMLTSLVLILIYQNCAPIHSSKLGADSESSANSTIELLSLFEKTLHPVLKSNCASCHGVSQQPLFAVNDPDLSLQAIQQNNLMDLNFPENSKFVTKVKPGHNGHSTVTAQLIQDKIQEIIDGLDSLNLDTTNPSIMISSPSGQANITSNIQITAIATDDKGIASVQFYVDGAELGPVVTTSPYTAQWNIAALSNGSYDLTARALDTSGNFKLSEIITVNITVNNTVENPNATFTWINSNILVPSCVQCHGSSKADAGVRYNTYAETIKTAKAGNLSGSKLYTTCNTGSMPDKAAKLSATKIQAISDWIKAGALNN